MTQSNRYFLVLVCVVVAMLACKNDDGDEMPPEVMVDEEVNVADLNLENAAMARVEDLVLRDLTSPEPNYVNYGVVLTSEQLEQVQFGDKMFWQIDEDNLSDNVRGVVFNLYSPIVVQEGTAEQNLLGEAEERTFTMGADPLNNSEGDYLYQGVSFSILDRIDFNNTRAYFATRGTIKIEGTFPNLELTFDLVLEDDVRLLTARLEGTVQVSFQVIENR